MTIPLYDYDGSLAYWIDQKQLQRLQDLGLISRVVKRSKNRAARAILHRMPGEARSITLRDDVGTKYCFRQYLADGHRCYRLRALGDNQREERDLAPAEVRPIFLTVVWECMAA